MFSNIAASRDFGGGSNTNISFIGKQIGSIAVIVNCGWFYGHQVQNPLMFQFGPMIMAVLLLPFIHPWGFCASFVTTCYRKCHDEPWHERCGRLIDQ